MSWLRDDREMKKEKTILWSMLKFWIYEYNGLEGSPIVAVCQSSVGGAFYGWRVTADDMRGLMMLLGGRRR